MEPLRKCAEHKPAFGKSGRNGGITVDVFQRLYGADPLYHWFGLDSEMMYAAHKASSGMTSIYRQLGVGCERFFREIAKQALGLTDEQVQWSYTLTGDNGRLQTLTLDGRIVIDDIEQAAAKKRVKQWIDLAAQHVEVDAGARGLQGSIFEVRQGYKSADSKRQNADIRSGSRAYADGYLPVIALFSQQMNEAVERRYRQAKFLVLTGSLDGSSVESTYGFCRDVVGFDAAAFFERNTDRLRGEFLEILDALMSPE